MASPEPTAKRQTQKRRGWLSKPIGWRDLLVATGVTAALVSALDALEGHVQAALIAWLP